MAAAVLAFAAAGCDALFPGAAEESAAPGPDKLQVVATTNILGDLVATIGGDDVAVDSLMGPGVDPHLYKASEGDVRRMAAADLVVYNGLHLEGKMTEIFERLHRIDKAAVAVGEAVPPPRRIAAEAYGGSYDPHVWFDLKLWQISANALRDALIAADPDHADGYRRRAAAAVSEMAGLDRWVRQQVATVPEDKRVLVTAHDAFAYFGRAYGIEVRGLLGISTASEAGTSDVQELADFIARRELPAVFVESTVPERYVEALKDAVRAKGGKVRTGGTLFSDALGEPNSPAGTYAGMVRHNVETIVTGLGGRVQ